jgi:hypothetical protein
MNNFETALLVVTILALVIFLVWFFREKEYTYAIDKLWTDAPKNAFNDVSSIIGAPDVIIPGDQSSAIWYRKNLLNQKIPFDKVMVFNDAAFGACPTPHPANVKINLKVNIMDTAHLLCILGGSLGFSYDAASQTLSVRCYTFGTAIAHVLFALTIIGKSSADAFSMYQDGSYKDTMKSLYSDIDSLSGDAYKSKVQEYMTSIGSLLPAFTPPTMSSGPDCVYPLDSDSVRALVANTPLCTPAAPSKSKDIKEDFTETTYRQLTIPCDGKVYNLGLPRYFKNCDVEKKKCEATIIQEALRQQMASYENRF